MFNCRGECTEETKYKFLTVLPCCDTVTNECIKSLEKLDQLQTHWGLAGGGFEQKTM